MNEEPVHDGGDRRNGASRRAALKAGVGVGVGLVAWSGPTITSLGGTPAYAVGCTFVVRTNVSGGCRNLDFGGGGCDYRYHSLAVGGLPAGYAVINPIPEGTCCGTWTSTLTFPPDVMCAVRVIVYLKAFADPTGQPCSGDSVSDLFGPEDDGSLDFSYPCFPEARANPFSVYTIDVVCNPTNAPPECLD